MSHGFDKVREMEIKELGSVAQIWRHRKTGGRVLSMINDDENKVFGLSFRTPPKDSTGVAHILEHSVLCGSRKYPVKEPFVELLKGSLQTFLNALTFPDKTCYPVASANHADFYNLVDVYLDAAFFPLLDEHRLKQEGWHYELDDPEGRMSYKGVVYNEMKGAYSSPDSLLYEYSQQSLFPDNTYGLDSGGDPFAIPDLTWEQFSEFHRTHYHPSNAYAYFYGDDDPEKRLEILDEYFNQFEPLTPEFSRVPLQTRFDKAVEVRKKFPASAKTKKGMFTVNWMLAETADANLNLALHILEHILIGLPSSPLRKALMDSGLGDDLAGVGLEADIRQMFFSVGLKGVHPANAVKVEALIHDTLSKLVKDGIDPKDVEAAVNSVEFDLRENNTGSYPRGLSLMFQSLSTWLYDSEDGSEGDPLLLLPFEEPLRNIKTWVGEGEKIFEELLSRLLLQNPHRSTVLLEPDSELGKELTTKERERLEKAKQAMSEEDVRRVIDETAELRRLQEAPDTPEALATIPRLSKDDLPEENVRIPSEEREVGGVTCHFHDLHTSGIAYADLAFDISGVPDELLPLVPLMGRALVEAGTKKRDYVDLSQWIARTTGGISPQVLCQPVLNSPEAAQRLIVRVKTTGEKLPETAEILKEILTEARLDDKVRIRQIVQESVSRLEQALVPSGHIMVARRLKARAHQAHAMEEAMTGITALEALRTLSERVENDFRRVGKEFVRLAEIILRRGNLVLNATCESSLFDTAAPLLADVVAALPEGASEPAERTMPSFPEREGLAIPAQVNYVGKGVNIYEQGIEYHGSMNAVSKFLRTGYLWDRIRVLGGAYGGFTVFDSVSGSLNYLSYRDPNVEKTIENYDGVVQFLEGLDLPDGDLETAVIGAIGEMDSYQLPDAKGFTSFVRTLTGQTPEHRDRVRSEIMNCTADDFRAMAKAARAVAEKGDIVVMGNEPAMDVSGLNLDIKEIV